MNLGQELALEQLHAIEAADKSVFEIVRTELATKEKPFLTVELSLNCGGIELVSGGLPLRERERFILWIPADFPFEMPIAFTNHERFAGRPHVQWKRRLCIYQAPQTEWDSSDGMFGFIQRLWTWLEVGAKNLADPAGQAIHPPVAYTGESKFVIVPRANTPEIGNRPWFGFAGLSPINTRAISLVNWQPVSNQDPVGIVAAVILLPYNLPWEMPTKLDGLCIELERSGIKREVLLCVLQWVMVVNPKDYPLFVVIGSPQRGNQSEGVLKQHLMVWQVSGLVHTALNLSRDFIRMQLDLHGLTTPEADRIRDNAKAYSEELTQIALASIKSVDVNWCSVQEDRPEIITRRDERSLLGFFRGKNVCLWGCGALGSHVAYCLVKGGVKKLTLLDCGTVRTGLLVRQMFAEDEIAQSKALALRDRLKKMDPSVEIEAFRTSVFAEPEAAMGADIVIDCTAADAVHAKSELTKVTQPKQIPPMISMIVGPRAERSIVVFVNSNSAGGIKDAYRKAKLTACQRPELLAFADDFYPKGNAFKIFQPEPGCSDATFEGSCADVTALSALLLSAGAKLLRESAAPSAACFICQPHLADPEIGHAGFAEFQFEPDLICQCDYQVRLSPRAWREMAAAIRQGRRKRNKLSEIGGLLFGKRDDGLRVIWIDDAIGPPPDSICTPEKFICGTKGTQEAAKKRKENSRSSTEFVGMWHTHPQDAPLPSTTDISGMAQLLSSGQAPPMRSLLMIVAWMHNELLLGTSVFSRNQFREGNDVVSVAVNRFPEVKI